MLQRALRAFGILLGFFLLATAVLDLLALIPYSAAVPPLRSRLWTDTPLVIGGFTLLTPFRKLQGHPAQAGAVVFLLILCLQQTAFSATGIMALVNGKKSLVFLPVSLINLLILWGNLALLLSRRSQRVA